jgi:cytochrome c-type biogenesis protein CcmH
MMPSLPRKRKALSNGASGSSIATIKMDSRFRGNDVGVVRSACAHTTRMIVALLFAFAFSSFAFAVVDPLPFKDRAEELRFQNLTKQLRCLVCQNESLNDSSAPLAADLRRDVFEQMQAGKNDDEIKHWLTARYSDFVLYDPPLRSGTWLLWFGPLLVLAAGGVAIFTTVRRRARATTASSAARPASDVEDDW